MAQADDFKHVFYATATVYNIDESQTDDSPQICADGTKSGYDKRIIAVSREQLWRWGGFVRYGDRVRVTGAGKHDGVWNVHDTMNRRYGAYKPTYDSGVKGVVEPGYTAEYSVDGVAHIDFQVKDTLGKWLNVKVEVLK